MISIEKTGHVMVATLCRLYGEPETRRLVAEFLSKSKRA